MGYFSRTPAFERRRLEAFKRAVARPEYAAWSTGPRTPAGGLKMATNATKHGADSQVVKLAMQYADAVLQALEPEK